MPPVLSVEVPAGLEEADWVRAHFTVANEHFVCKFCQKTFAYYKNSIQNPRTHIKRKHLADYDTYLLGNSGHIDKRVLPIDKKRDAIAYLLCRYGIPFHIERDPEWAAFASGAYANALAGIKLRDIVVGSAVRQEHKFAGAYGNSFVTLCVDGTTSNGKHALAFTAILKSRSSSNTNTICLGCDFIADSTGETIANALRGYVAKIQEQGGQIVVVTGDNAANVTAAIQKVGLPHCACMVHTSQLAIKDSVLSFDYVCRAVAILENNSRFCKLPNEIRWWSTLNCLEAMRRQIKRKVFSVGADGMTTINLAIDYLTRFRKLGRMMEADSCTVPRGMELYYQMSCISNEHTTSFAERAMLITTPCVVAAAALHHEFAWGNFNKAEVALLYACVLGYAYCIVRPEDKSSFEEKFALEFRAMRQAKKRTSLFFLELDADYPILSEVYSTTSSSICSEASVERYFSAYGRIFTARRNAMSPVVRKSACQLAFNYSGLKRERDSRASAKAEPTKKPAAQAAPPQSILATADQSSSDDDVVEVECETESDDDEAKIAATSEVKNFDDEVVAPAAGPNTDMSIVTPDTTTDDLEAVSDIRLSGKAANYFGDIYIRKVIYDEIKNKELVKYDGHDWTVNDRNASLKSKEFKLIRPRVPAVSYNAATTTPRLEIPERLLDR